MALAEKAKKVADSAGSKKTGKAGGWKAKIVPAVVKEEVTDEAAARRKRAGDEDVCQLAVVKEVPRNSGDLEQNGSCSLYENESRIDNREWAC